MTLTMLAAQAGAGGGSTSMIIMLVAMFAIMYFFMIRPQQKKQKEIRAFQSSLQVGSKVVTGSGVHGEVKKIDIADPVAEVEIAKGVVIKVEKSYLFAAAPEQK